jgi:hypothetical protein
MKLAIFPSVYVWNVVRVTLFIEIEYVYSVVAVFVNTTDAPSALLNPKFIKPAAYEMMLLLSAVTPVHIGI